MSNYLTISNIVPVVCILSLAILCLMFFIKRLIFNKEMLGNVLFLVFFLYFGALPLSYFYHKYRNYRELTTINSGQNKSPMSFLTSTIIFIIQWIIWGFVLNLIF